MAMSDKRVLITGAAGFIGFHASRAFLADGARVLGYDNVNSYYDPEIKRARLAELEGVNGFDFMEADLTDEREMERAFAEFKPTHVINLAAQAGVRYSITNPRAYIDSNLIGFFNVLEACRHHPVEHLVYASSSSVYGDGAVPPFSVDEPCNSPVSLYAATKKSNELMAYAYTSLYGINATGLRVFTVYGPFGRPDMAAFIFTRKILAGEPISLFNYGDMYRDFTYIDDIVGGITRVAAAPMGGHRVYNIGNNSPVKLTDFVSTLENAIGLKAKIELLPMQKADVYSTCANVDALTRDYGFKPSTPLAVGLKRFVDWYKNYYNV